MVESLLQPLALAALLPLVAWSVAKINEHREKQANLVDIEAAPHVYVGARYLYVMNDRIVVVPACKVTSIEYGRIEVEVDEDGTRHSFTLAEWKALHPRYIPQF